MNLSLVTVVVLGMAWLAYDASRRRAAGQTLGSGYRALLWACAGLCALVALAAAGVSVLILMESSANRGFSGILLLFLPVVCLTAALVGAMFFWLARQRPAPPPTAKR